MTLNQETGKDESKEKNMKWNIIITRPAWAGFKTAEVGIAIIMCFIW